MTDTAKLETLLGAGGEVRLARREAQEVLQKLRARGAGGATADRLESRLARTGEVVLEPTEAYALLEELRASGRRWVFGSDAPAAQPPVRDSGPVEGSREAVRPRSGPVEALPGEPGGSPDEAASHQPEPELERDPEPEPEPEQEHRPEPEPEPEQGPEPEPERPSFLRRFWRR